MLEMSGKYGVKLVAEVQLGQFVIIVVEECVMMALVWVVMVQDVCVMQAMDDAVMAVVDEGEILVLNEFVTLVWVEVERELKDDVMVVLYEVAKLQLYDSVMLNEFVTLEMD